jgi:hypothetical protein
MRSKYPEQPGWNASACASGPAKNNQAKGVRWAKDYVLGDKVKVADAAG